MPSYYTHQEKLFDVFWSLWSPWQPYHALNSMFYTQNASSSNPAFIQHLDLKISEFV